MTEQSSLSFLNILWFSQIDIKVNIIPVCGTSTGSHTEYTYFVKLKDKRRHVPTETILIWLKLSHINRDHPFLGLFCVEIIDNR